MVSYKNIGNELDPMPTLWMLTGLTILVGSIIGKHLPQIPFILVEILK
jgi:hypothetical protein